ncbi:ABC transporter ATP-binding protein [Niveibacterium sp.]|uniref:ABC transporter ATP-binding protein n=1 Tax=Niveibacterium sp. TaxID=2017444 RepID=UPI0035B12F45
MQPEHNNNRGDLARAVALLAQAARPESRRLLIALLGLACAAGLEVLGPMLGKAFIDGYLIPRRADIGGIALLIGGSLLAVWCANGLRYLQLLSLSGVAARSVQRLRERVYGHVLRLPVAYFDRAITGQLVSRVTNDTEAVKALYVQVLFVMLDSVIVLCGSLAAMAWLDLRLMGVVTLLIPAVIGIVWFYKRLSAPAVARARELRSEINAQIAESIAGMPVLQATGAAGRFAARFEQANRAHYDARRAELRANAWLLRPALDLLNVLLLVGVLASFAGRGSVAEVGVLYAFVGLMARVIEPLIQITLQFSQLQQSLIAASRVGTLLAEPLAAPAGESGRIGAGEVALRELAFGYDPAHPVIHDLSLTIAAGSFHGIVGHTGSGKSTLLALLLRFYAPQSGAIEIDGAPISELGDATFRSAVGLVPQEPFLLAANARENIDMGRGLSDAEIESAARAARAHDFILALPEGYATPLGEGGARLSVGQKQLIAIARALAGQPKILLLDEATSHIDSETEQVVQAALAELRGRVTIIAIAHRLSTIRDADAITVLNHGRIAERGHHDDLMAIDGGIYRRLYELQQIED